MKRIGMESRTMRLRVKRKRATRRMQRRASFT
jgi:hypothetical protein